MPVSASAAKYDIVNGANATMPIVTPLPYITNQSEAVNSTTPYLNVLNPDSPYYGKISLPAIPPSNFANITNNTRIFSISPQTTLNQIYFGTQINTGQYVGGASSVQQILPTYTVPTGDTLYAAALISPNGDPLEICCNYNGTNSYGGHLYWGVFDHVQKKWVVYDPVDTTFQSNYVRNINGLCDAIEQCILYSGGSWNVYIVNWNTEEWENPVSAAYTWSDGRNGWDLWEAWYVKPYPTQPSIRSETINVYTSDDNEWHEVTSNYGGQYPWNNPTYNNPNPPYTTTWNSNYYDWTVSY